MSQPIKADLKHRDADFLNTRKGRIWEFIRILRIAREFILGFRTFHFLKSPCITVFGSARFKEDHPYSIKARTLGAMLAKKGVVVMTGGGPGIMEASNRGAKEANGVSIGANIVLPHEQKPNSYLDHVVTFSYFFVRKVILLKYSQGYVIFPGGFGTLDELSEALTLIQTGKLQQFPVVLIGVEFWTPFVDFLRDRLLRDGAIGPEAMDLFLLTDDLDEAIQALKL